VTKSVSAAAALATPTPSLFSDSGTLAQRLVDAYLAVRDETERRAAPLSAEDQLIQSMPDASPAKWHRAHTTWFFEQFLLGEHCEGYQVFHPDYAFLFNSYYVSAGHRHARHQRGHLTRPSADEVTAAMLAQILEQNGLINFIVHPDYITKDRESRIYQELLAHLAWLRTQKNAWVAAPGEIDRWWRQRSKMELVSDGDEWRVEGAGSERARVAYATERDGRLVFTVQNSTMGELSEGTLKHS